MNLTAAQFSLVSSDKPLQSRENGGTAGWSVNSHWVQSGATKGGSHHAKAGAVRIRFCMVERGVPATPNTPSEIMASGLQSRLSANACAIAVKRPSRCAPIAWSATNAIPRTAAARTAARTKGLGLANTAKRANRMQPAMRWIAAWVAVCPPSPCPRSALLPEAPMHNRLRCPTRCHLARPMVAAAIWVGSIVPSHPVTGAAAVIVRPPAAESCRKNVTSHTVLSLAQNPALPPCLSPNLRAPQASGRLNAPLARHDGETL